MSPGPKRKGKKDFSNQRANARHTNVAPPSTSEDHVEVEKQTEASFQNTTLSEAERTDDNYVKNQKKYNKRQVQSNWSRYEEHTPGLLEDTLRGESFEVLASYQGGADSYFKFKEEKEWPNATDLQDGLYLDCDELVQSLKCIPLHKRLHLPEDCCTPEMLQKFQEAADKNYSRKPGVSLSLPCMKNDLPILGPFSNFEDVNSEISYKPKVISEKTENIILSLTSCMARKNETSKMPPKVEPEPTLFTSDDSTEEKQVSLTSDDAHHSSLPKPETAQEDLALLLSLSGSDKHFVDAVEEKGSSASIEDWLNELLEK